MTATKPKKPTIEFPSIAIPKVASVSEMPTQKPEVDWFAAHNRSEFLQKTIQRRPEAQGFLNFMWPTTPEYYSPIPAIYLNEVSDLLTLNTRPMWMAREGLVSLLWFFRSIPKPPRLLRTRLLVHKSAAPFVPTAWRSMVGTWEFQNTHPETTPKKLFFFSMVMDTYCSLISLREQLSKIETRLGSEELRKMEKMVYFFPKQEGFGNEKRSQFLSEFHFEFASRAGTNIHSINWDRFINRDNFEGWHFYDLNEGLLWRDNFCVYHTCSRGGQLLSLETPNNEGHLIELSPHHGIRVVDEVQGDYALENLGLHGVKKSEAMLRFEAAMRSEANMRLPWPDWYAELGKLVKAMEL